MRYLKHRAWTGVLTLVCLLTGILTISPIPVISGQASADTGPDLTIDTISWSPEAPAFRDTVTFTTTIKNQGDSPVPLSRIVYYIDNNLISYADIDPIDATDIAVHTFTWQATAGDHIIKAVIDSDNAIAEINEDNNVKVYAFSVIAADLIIDSITWSPEIVSAGDTVNFTVTVKNRGNKTSSYCWGEFFIDGSSRGQREVGRIDPGANKTIDYSWIAQVGEHTLKATADVLNQAVESNETNNDLTQDYHTTPPDLIINTIEYSPSNRTDTDNVTMHITVKNAGLGDSYGSWLNLYIDDVLKTSVFVNPLNAGATSTKLYNWLVGPEEHIFTATIDSDNWVVESDESNNTRSITLPALGPPDLLIQNITWTPQQPAINSQMTFTITVKNVGKRAVEKCYLDFYAAYGCKFSKQLGPILVGGTASVSLEYITSTVPINVRAIVDPDDIITESDESNNEKTASLTLVETATKVDFYITSLTCTVKNPALGDEVTITSKIKNNGTQAAGESYIAYYVDGDIIETVLIKRISARGTITNSITWIATPGTHTIRVVADFNDYVLELNESNNSKETTISTSTSDLAIKSITWSPEIPLHGDALNITFTIINQGTLETDGCYISYYVDDSYQGNHYIEEIAPGGTVTRIFPWVLSNSMQTFKVIIDEDNSVIESDESNNEKIAVIPAPDLIIESITCSPTEFSENNTVIFVITIQNVGTTQVESTHLDCYINNILQDSVPVTSISAGASAEVIFYWTAKSGKNIFMAAIDGADTVTESNESNNEGSITLQTQEAITEVIPSLSETSEETSENVTSNETEQDTPLIFDASELPPAQAEEIPSDVSPDASTDEPPLWQNILMNKWMIIGVVLVGVASIFVLLRLHKRAQLA